MIDHRDTKYKKKIDIETNKSGHLEWYNIFFRFGFC